MGLNFQVRSGWRLVRSRYAGEVLYNPCFCLLIDALLVTHGADYTGAFYIDLYKLAFLQEGPYFLSIPAIGGDKSSENYDACINEKLYQFTNSADIFFPVSRGEGQIGAKTVTDVVAIKYIGKVTPAVKLLFHQVSYGGFPRSGKTGEPDHRSFVAVEFFPIQP